MATLSGSKRLVGAPKRTSLQLDSQMQELVINDHYLRQPCAVSNIDTLTHPIKTPTGGSTIRLCQLFKAL